MFEFIRTHHSEGSKTDSDSDILKAFEGSNTVNYNNGNIVFEVKTCEADLWVDFLTKRLGKPQEHENDSLRFKVQDFKLPRLSTSVKTNYGSVTVTFWPKPKTTHPKIMVQGKCYLAFVTFIVPLIIKDIKSAQDHALAATKYLELAVDSEDEYEDKHDSISLSKALKRLEGEVLNMRNDMAERLDVALGSHKPSLVHII